MHLTQLPSLVASALTLLTWGAAGYADELALGLLHTIFIAVFAFVLGHFIGFLAALARLSQLAWLARISWLYSTVFRAVPELVLILILYYAGGDLTKAAARAIGVTSPIFDGATAAIIVLGLVQGAYSAEILRGSILAVPRGYKEAALSLGFTTVQAFRYVTLPLMVPFALPGVSNLWLSLTKATALISVVGYTELTLATQQAAGGSKQYFLFYGVSLFLYLWISLISGRFFRWVESSYALTAHHTISRRPV